MSDGKQEKKEDKDILLPSTHILVTTSLSRRRVSSGQPKAHSLVSRGRPRIHLVLLRFPFSGDCDDQPLSWVRSKMTHLGYWNVFNHTHSSEKLIRLRVHYLQGESYDALTIENDHATEDTLNHPNRFFVTRTITLSGRN